MNFDLYRTDCFWNNPSPPYNQNNFNKQLNNYDFNFKNPYEELYSAETNRNFCSVKESFDKEFLYNNNIDGDRSSCQYESLNQISSANKQNDDSVCEKNGGMVVEKVSSHPPNKTNVSSSSEVMNENTSSDQLHIFPWMLSGSRSDSKGAKRTRQSYTSGQTFQLEQEFHMNRYLNKARRIEMAHSLGLTERQIKIWFQNRRMKWKKNSLF